MDITEVSILHHMAIVLVGLWFLSYFNCCHPVAYVVSLIYLYLVHEQYITRLRKKLQFEERKQANQRRVLCDSETVRWLNHAVEKIWPICMEQIVSQKILLPIIPWFLEKYKPWTAKEAVVQSLYMGRNPPMITDIRVLRQSTDDDHLVLELGMNFLTADDMSAILAVKLRKRLGFGMWAKLHITGMHVEGKVLVGVKFLPKWPFLGRLRVCFVEPPYFQMTVKPIFTHGLDVTEFPGIAGWLDKLLSIAFEQTLVEPNMLVVDMEKFVSPQAESWFSVNEKEPIAYAKVEVVEASDMKPSDLNGLADPYVKGQLGAYRFRTKTQKKTLSPKWHEEFKIPIFSWDLPNVLSIDVRDKDHFVDDTLGDCTINISDLRDGQRHDMWLSLQNIKMGRLHLAITLFEDSGKGDDEPQNRATINKEDIRDFFVSETAHKGSFSSVASEKSPKVADNFEPIDVDGQQQTGIWVHRPGTELSQIWEPRKGKGRRLDTKICSEANDYTGSSNLAASGSYNNDSSSTDENPEGNKSKSSVRRGFKKLGSVFHRSSPREDHSGSLVDALPSPHANLKEVNRKEIGVNLIVEGTLSNSGQLMVSNADESVSPEGSGSPNKGHVKVMAKSIMKHAGNSARSIRHALSRKGSKSQGDSFLAEADRELLSGLDSSSEESVSHSAHSPPVERTPVVSDPSRRSFSDDPVNSKGNRVLTNSTEPLKTTEVSANKEKTEYLRGIDELSNSDVHNDKLDESSSNPKLLSTMQPK